MIMDDDNMSYDDGPIKDEPQHEITRARRIDPPADYTFRINSYSVLSEIGMKTCESGDFEIDGYKWKLILYPNGDEKVDDHISLYLAISSKDLPLGWEVKVIFRFFIFDQIKDSYLTIQDGKVRKYSKMKSEHGFSHLLSHKAFNKASNGFLVDNCCTFGVEVSLLKPSNKGESLTIIKEPQQFESSYWSIYSFSTKTDESYLSNPFNVKGRQWRMKIYPNGFSSGKTTHLSLYLKLDSSETIPVGKKIYAKFILSVYNRVDRKYIDKSAQERWFDNTTYGSGFHEFLSRKDLSNHLDGDVLYLKARIVAMSTVEEF